MKSLMKIWLFSRKTWNARIQVDSVVNPQASVHCLEIHVATPRTKLDLQVELRVQLGKSVHDTGDFKSGVWFFDILLKDSLSSYWIIKT